MNTPCRECVEVRDLRHPLRAFRSLYVPHTSCLRRGELIWLQCSRHQGGIEAIFIDAMKEKGLHVERPTIPTSLELSEDVIQLQDPRAYPIKVYVYVDFVLFSYSNTTPGYVETPG